MIQFTCTKCGRQCCPTNDEEALVCSVCAESCDADAARDTYRKGDLQRAADAWRGKIKTPEFCSGCTSHGKCDIPLRMSTCKYVIADQIEKILNRACPGIRFATCFHPIQNRMDLAIDLDGLSIQFPIYGEDNLPSLPPDEAAQAVVNAATVGEAVLDAAAAVRAERDQLRARLDELRETHEALRVETGWAQKARIRELTWLLGCYRQEVPPDDLRRMFERIGALVAGPGKQPTAIEICDLIRDEVETGRSIKQDIALLRVALLGDAAHKLADDVISVDIAREVAAHAAHIVRDYRAIIGDDDATFARIPPLETAPDAPEFFLPAAGDGAYRVVNEYYAPWDMEIGGRDVPMRTRFLLVHEVPEDPFERGLEDDEAALAALLQARFAWAITPSAGEGPIRCAMRLLEEYAAAQVPGEQNNKRHDLDNMTVEDVVAMCNEVPGQSAHAVDGGMMVGYDESCGPVTIVAVAPKPTDPPAGFTPRQRALWTAIRTYGLALPGGGTTTLWEGSPDPVALCAALTGAGTLCPEDPALAPQVAAVLNSVRGVTARVEADGAVAFWPTTIGVTVDPDDPPDHCPEAL